MNNITSDGDWLPPSLRRQPSKPQINQHQSIDYKALNTSLLPRLAQLIKGWLPKGRREGNEWKVGSRKGEQGSSFSINVVTGLWADFSEDDPKAKGGDVISLYAYIFELSNHEAANALSKN